MKNIGLFYFSGTGNTKIVAELIKDSFIQQGYTVDLFRMEDVLKNQIDLKLDQYDMLGFGSQVIGYGMPNLVKDFLRKLPKGNQQKTFIFRTAGGVAPINYNVSRGMIATLKRKGYAVFHERLFSLGSNWINRFADPVVHGLYQATKAKTDVMVKELIEGKERFYKTGLGLRIAMGAVSLTSSGFFRLTAQDYKVSSDCTNCGLCVKNCPAQNIVSKNGKIRFKLNCSCCMRCLYNCPKQAIQFKTLKFFQVEGGYNIKKTLEKILPEGESAVKEPPFFSQYVMNIDY